MRQKTRYVIKTAESVATVLDASTVIEFVSRIGKTDDKMEKLSKWLSRTTGEESVTIEVNNQRITISKVIKSNNK